MTGAVLFTAQGTKHVSDQDILDSYLGTVKEDGMRHGEGVYTFPNSFFQYKGNYADGVKEGHGRLELSDGSVFEGMFRGGEINGLGKRVWADGTVLTCHFVLGEAEGEGVLQSSKDWVYKGSFANNRPDGIGIREESNGGRYEGCFSNGQFHGQGALCSPDGYKYSGLWQKGKPHGEGHEVMPSGQTFEGQFSNGKYHGIGSLKMHDGRIYNSVCFQSGELKHPAVQLELQYPKNVNKKGVEQPVALDAATVVPAQFIVSVRVLCTQQQEEDAVHEPAATGNETGDSGLQTMTFESGRSVFMKLQQGHGDADGTAQPLKGLVFKMPERTATPSEGTKSVQGESEEGANSLESLCAVTEAGECVFQGFQIGGEGLEPLESGPYTLVVSSTGLPDENILIQLSAPKGKKK